MADGVVEPAEFQVFLSRPFSVPKRDSPFVGLVVEFSQLIHRGQKIQDDHGAQALLHLRQLEALDLENAYWHVPRRVSTNLTKEIAAELSVRGVVLLYLDDCLLFAPSLAEALTIFETTIQVTEDMGF